jgi:hypothetical protein
VSWPPRGEVEESLHAEFMNGHQLQYGVATFHQTLGRIGPDCAHLGSELVGGLGVRHGWHEDGVPRSSTLGRIGPDRAHLRSEFVGGLGVRRGWHEDGVPQPGDVDALEGLIVLGR